MLQTFGSPENSALKAIPPLYGLSESPSYLWITFPAHHEKFLGKKSSVLDPCLFFKHNKKETDIEGLQAVLVDDNLGSGTEQFDFDSQRTNEVFQTKPRNHSFHMKFNGM